MRIVPRSEARLASAASAAVLVVVPFYMLAVLCDTPHLAYFELFLAAVVVSASSLPFALAAFIGKPKPRAVALYVGGGVVALAASASVVLVAVGLIKSVGNFPSAVIANHLQAFALVLLTAALVRKVAFRRREAPAAARVIAQEDEGRTAA